MAHQYALLIAALLFPGGLFALALGLALKGPTGASPPAFRAALGRRSPSRSSISSSSVSSARWFRIRPSETVFLCAPLVGAASMLLAAALIPIAGVYAPDPQIGNLLVLLYLLAVPGVALMIAGSRPARPTARSASRAKWR